MKRLLTLTMLISLAMICSCQKQSSTAEQQLAQRKAELDAREKALDEREKALAEREDATANARTIPRSTPGQVRDPAQLTAERERRLQQLPPDAQALIRTPPQMAGEKDEKGKRREERIAQKREERQRERMSRSSASKPQAPALAVDPQDRAAKLNALNRQAEATSPPQLAPLSVYPQPDATSPSPSPTPQ